MSLGAINMLSNVFFTFILDILLYSFTYSHLVLGVYDEVKAMKEACGESVHMKVILATGELGSLVNVYKASMVTMMAGKIKKQSYNLDVNAWA